MYKNKGFVLVILVLMGLVTHGFSGEMMTVENFTLKDYNGKAHALKDYQDSKAIVLMFIATQCPVSNNYNKRMAQLSEEYKDKNIVFIGINSNKQESVEEIAEHSQKNGFEFPVLKDDKNIIADKFKAQVTPEIFVLNSDLQVLYHGRIDDSQRESGIKSKDLRTALDEILAEKSVSMSTTKAFGCSIKRVK